MGLVGQNRTKFEEPGTDWEGGGGSLGHKERDCRGEGEEGEGRAKKRDR